MSLDKAMAKVKELAAGRDGALGSTVKFSFPEGVILIDDTKNPSEVSNRDAAAACTIKMELNDFMKLLNGDIDPMGAFMGGLMKIEGDMGIAMKLTSFF